MRLVIGFALVGLLSATASGAPADDRGDGGLPAKNPYEACVELSRHDPQAALSAAVAWQGKGGDGAAGHCAAIALVSLKRFPEAATQLDRLGHENVGGASERASLFDQAGNAWLLSRRGAEAFASFSSALALTPHNADFLADRARAAALLNDWKAAETDLTAALAQDPNRADFFVLRASARRALGRPPEARADLEKALHIVPNYAEALVDRGTLRLEAGDRKGAQADWQAVLKRVPGSPEAAAAEQHLTALAEPNPTPTPK